MPLDHLFRRIGKRLGLTQRVSLVDQSEICTTPATVTSKEVEPSSDALVGALLGGPLLYTFLLHGDNGESFFHITSERDQFLAIPLGGRVSVTYHYTTAVTYDYQPPDFTQKKPVHIETEPHVFDVALLSSSSP